MAVNAHDQILIHNEVMSYWTRIYFKLKLKVEKETETDGGEYTQGIFS